MTDAARLLECHQSDPTCLAKFHAERVEGIDSTNEAASVGTACHRACESLAYAMHDEELDHEKQFAVASQAIEAAALDLRMTSLAKQDAMQIMERATAPTSRVHFGTPTGWSSAAEYHWRLDAKFKPTDGDALCAGTIDRLDWSEEGGEARITDFKTTKSWQAKEDIHLSWQARVYSMATLLVFPGLRRVKFRFANLRNGYPVEDEFRRDEPWFEATKARILELRAEREVAVELDQWPEVMGPDCTFCPVKFRCGAWKLAAAQGREIPADMDSGEIGRRALGLRALATAYEARAEAIVEASQAPIDIGRGLGLGMRPATKWGLAPKFEGEGGYERLMQALADLGMTEAQKVEWFRYCQEGHVPSRVKDALYELLGPRVGGQAIEDMTYVEPSTRWEFGAWLTETGKRAKPEAVDQAVGDLAW